MSEHDHGATGFGQAADFEKLARQYWSAFGDFARNPASGFAAAPAIPGLQDGLAWWTQLLNPQSSQLAGALGRMQSQGADWYGMMQQVAAMFAGRDAAPDQISTAWQRLLGDQFGPNGVAELFRRMAGPGTQGFEQWLAQVQPWLANLTGGHLPGAGLQQWQEAIGPMLAQFQKAASPQAWQPQFAAALAQMQKSAMPHGMQDQLAAALRLPTFGLAREHQERWQALLQAQLDYHQANHAFNELLLRVGQRAFERFEAKLEERSEPGRQLDSARALFDLWIDAAEDAWAQIALTEEFRRVYGALANTQMRLRGAVQGEIEQIASAMGLPTRTEMDASHRKVAALERELRKLRGEIDEAAHASRMRAPQARARGVAANDADTRDDIHPSPDDEAPAAAPVRAKRPRQRQRAAAATPAKTAQKAPAKQRKKASSARASRRIGVLPMVAAPRAVDVREKTPRRKPGKGKSRK